MKTLNICVGTFFVLAFFAGMIGTQDIPLATVVAFVASVPLYLMGLMFRWFVRGLVK